MSDDTATVETTAVSLQSSFTILANDAATLRVDKPDDAWPGMFRVESRTPAGTCLVNVYLSRDRVRELRDKLNAALGSPVGW